MLLNRQTKGKCICKELVNEKTVQEENIKVVLENLGNDYDCPNGSLFISILHQNSEF